ncbi:MAG: hypothetical protein AB1758_00455, partial [Candidatus Eremiobacterota bacterium]
MTRWLLLALLGLLLASCGDGGPVASAPAPVGVAPVPVGTVVVRHNLARAVPARVDGLRFRGFNAVGVLIYGPVKLPKAPEVVLNNVPVDVVTLDIDYLEGELLAGAVRLAVRVSESSVTLVEDPDFTPIDLTGPAGPAGAPG